MGIAIRALGGLGKDYWRKVNKNIDKKLNDRIMDIVGVKNAIKILKDEDLAEVDAEQGIVRILKKKE